MADVHPFGGPGIASQREMQGWAFDAGFTTANAQIAAAIAMAESGGDYTVVNDTPATGDYSVGCWQVNYYGSLYAGRVAQFGTPRQLVAAGVAGQAKAAYAIWRGQGFSAWSTYRSGAYRQFMAGGGAGSGFGPHPGQTTLPSPTISPPTEDYSDVVYKTASVWRDAASTWHDAISALRSVKDTTPHG